MGQMSNSEENTQSRRMEISAASWVRGFLVLLIFLALFMIRDVVLVLVTSIVIASAVEPAAIALKKRGIPRVISILSVYASGAIILVGLFYFLFVPLLGEASNFLRNLPDLSSSLQGGVWNNLTGAISAEDIAEHINSLVGSFSQGALSGASVFFGGIFSFILIVVLSFYLSVQDDGVGKFLRVITPWKHEKYVIGLWKRSRAKIGLWMQGQIVLAVIVMILVYLGLMLAGVEHALLLAVAAGVLEIIPLFGPILAAIPAVVVAFTGGGASLALIVAGLFLIIQQFENHLIYPLVVKKVVGVPPMVSIIALLVGAKIAGFLGMIIAVPLATILMEFLRDLEEKKIALQTQMEKSNPNG
jgi:predicted PurR-regulated permease PerM